jgi:hypothetical protein
VRSFPPRSAYPSDSALLNGKVYIASFVTDEGFINLNISRELAERALLHREPNTVKDMPRRLLSDAKTKRQLSRATPLLRAGKHQITGSQLV